MPPNTEDPLASPAAGRRSIDPHTLTLLGLLCLLYVPFAGHYGLWDPWETHYGEVARQMVERGDWISLWWPGSPNDRVTFWSKPVLTFWCMALSLKLFGLGRPGVEHADEMTRDWTAEWALRLPGLLFGMLGVWAAFHLVRGVAGRRAALWTGIVLGTASQWTLITRQAMTDMPFVAPMTVALAFVGLALMLPAEQVQAELPRRSVSLGRLRLDWPHDRAFYGFLGIYLLCVLPQLVVYLVQMRSFTMALGGRLYQVHGSVAVLPWVVLFVLSLLWVLRGRTRRSVYLWVAYLSAGLACLAKGPAGLGLPALSVLAYLLTTGRLREFLGRRRQRPLAGTHLLPRPLRVLGEYEGGLELLRGSLVFLCVGGAWYAMMLARHGLPFWMELVGDNYINRAQGRHGDRGTFEYYLRQLGAGLFPWSGLVATALLGIGRWLRQETASPRRHLALFCLCWFVTDLVVVSLVNTKFHHYILPALPALAVLAGLLLDELLAGLHIRPAAVALLLFGLPLTWLAGRDLGNFPARIGWLFNYDYVNMPGTGRPWPLPSIYGERYEYGGQVLTLVLVALSAQGALCAWLWLRRPVPEPDADTALPTGVRLVGGLVLLLSAALVAPSSDLVAHWASAQLPRDAVAPMRLRLGFLVPVLAASAWLLGGLARGLRRPGGLAVAAVALSAVLWNGWVLDRFLIDLSPHWSQKHVFAAYYRLRKGPQEPVVVWYLFWRGENFYTRNQIYDHRLPPEDKTVFEREGDIEKLKAYLGRNRGRRVFFVCERTRLDRLRTLLPPEAQASLQVVDHSNNKLALSVAQL
ncbi:MAG: glycosyltransferase family 39 protein [Myxococcales bacterium]|nr:glycosyltransferase family 39 protein [Myxococcota bacterium]MDW8284226.1 glycosyltransferase family 39 protein [Myxococcales bacterium]